MVRGWRVRGREGGTGVEGERQGLSAERLCSNHIIVNLCYL